MREEVKCPECGSLEYETLTIDDVEKNDFDNELTLIEEVLCFDCQYQFSVKARYKLELLESELA